MKRKSKPQSQPVCIFCKGSSDGVQFLIFNPRFAPFGTACVACEKSVTPQQVLDAAPLLDQSATRDGMSNSREIDKARAAVVTPAENAAERNQWEREENEAESDRRATHSERGAEL